MSRLINLRSPYFIKVSSEDTDDRTLASATLDLYVWTGQLTDRPTQPTYELSKAVLGAQEFIVFEISELCRDQVNIIFDGITRNTEPVYIGYDVVKSYNEEDVDSDTESLVVFGLDGYVGHEEGIQATENLFRAPAPTTVDIIDEVDNLSVTIQSTLTDSDADFNFNIGRPFGFESTVNQSNVTYQWQIQRTGTSSFVDIPLATGPIYTVVSPTTNNAGTYRLVVTNNDGTIQRTSNEILATATTGDVTCNPLRVTSETNPIVIGSEIGNTAPWVLACDPSTATEPVLVGDLDLSGAGFVSATTSNIVSDGVRISTITFTVTDINTTATDRSGTVILNLRNTTDSTTETFEIHLSQAAEDSITGVNISTSVVSVGGGTVTISVSGNIGTPYRLETDRLFPVEIDSETLSEINPFITNADLEPITGVVGDTHVLTVSNNDTQAVRQLQIVAVNSNNSNNLVRSATITQSAPLRILELDESSLTFGAILADGDQTLNYRTNRPARLRIDMGEDHFTFVNPTGQTVTLNGGDTVELLDGSVDISAVRSSTAIRNEGRVSAVYLDSPTTVRDVCSLIQNPASGFMYFQDITSTADGSSGNGSISSISLNDGSGQSARFRVQANHAWRITVSGTYTSVSVHSNSGTGVADVRVLNNNTYTSGTTTLTLEDASGVGLSVNDTLSISWNTGVTSDPPENVILTLSSNVTTGIAASFSTVGTDPAGGTLTYTLSLFSNPNGVLSQIIGTNTTGDFSFTPDTPGEYRFRAVAVSGVSSLSTNSNIVLLTVIDSPAIAETLFVSNDDIILNADGDGQLLSVGDAQLSFSDSTTFVCSDPFLWGGLSSGTFNGGRSRVVTAPALNEDRTITGTIEFSTDNSSYRDATVNVRQIGQEPIDSELPVGPGLTCDTYSIQLVGSTAIVSYNNCENGALESLFLTGATSFVPSLRSSTFPTLTVGQARINGVLYGTPSNNPFGF